MDGWMEMGKYNKNSICVLPVIWKKIDWKQSEVKFDLKRHKYNLKYIYPSFMNPHEIRQSNKDPTGRSMAHTYSGGVETYEHPMGWERSLLEAYNFIMDKTTGRLN
jgi:hypothetical protein